MLNFTHSLFFFLHTLSLTHTTNLTLFVPPREPFSEPSMSNGYLSTCVCAWVIFLSCILHISLCFGWSTQMQVILALSVVLPASFVNPVIHFICFLFFCPSSLIWLFYLFYICESSYLTVLLMSRLILRTVTFFLMSRITVNSLISYIFKGFKIIELCL